MRPKYEKLIAWDEQEKKTKKALDKLLPFLSENKFVLSDWIDNNELLEEYGYTTELKEEIAGLKKELETLKRVIPESFIDRIDSLSLSDLMEIESKLT